MEIFVIREFILRKKQLSSGYLFYHMLAPCSLGGLCYLYHDNMYSKGALLFDSANRMSDLFKKKLQNTEYCRCCW